MREPRVRFSGVVRAEWLKIWSLRSSWYTLAATVAVFAAVGLLFAARLGGAFGPPPAVVVLRFMNAQVDVVMSGVNLAQLVIGVFGVMLITGDYASGMIRTTLAAVPRRLPVLWAKLLTLIMAALPVMVITCIGVFLIGQPLLDRGAISGASLADGANLRVTIATALYLTGIAILGLALGAILRSTAAAITALVALLFVLPGVLFLTLPDDWRDPVTRLLPSEAGESFTALSPDAGELSLVMGAVVFCVWLVAALVVAAVLLKRRAA